MNGALGVSGVLEDLEAFVRRVEQVVQLLVVDFKMRYLHGILVRALGQGLEDGVDGAGDHSCLTRGLEPRLAVEFRLIHARLARAAPFHGVGLARPSLSIGENGAVVSGEYLLDNGKDTALGAGSGDEGEGEGTENKT